MYWTLYSGPITYSARVPCTLCHKKPGTDGCCSSVLRVIPCLFCLSCILRSVRHWIWYLCSTYGWTDRWGVNVCDSLLHKCFLLSDVCEWLIELGVCRMCFGYASSVYGAWVGTSRIHRTDCREKASSFVALFVP